MNNFLEKYFQRHWSKETSYSKTWHPNRPSVGQCAITSLVIQEIMGGDIAKTSVNGLSHYFNIIDGNVYDFTRDQFDDEVQYEEFGIIERERILSSTDTRKRHDIFRSSLMKEITESLPPNEIEHISIRDPNYVAGSSDKPEVKVFCQTNKRSQPINNERMYPGQNVYMKWTGGPIVAKSTLVSWHNGTFNNGNVNKLRELTIGTNLFSLSDYWQSVSEKGNGYYSVIHLNNEEWLSTLLYPSIRSHGSSWIYLDTILKKVQWLSLSHEPIKETKKGRSIPASLRFLVLKRYGFTCKYCGRKAPDVELHVDHVIPWSKVKEHKIENLVAACRDCNIGKSDKEL
jgi:hypothetical protein